MALQLKKLSFIIIKQMLISKIVILILTLIVSVFSNSLYFSHPSNLYISDKNLTKIIQAQFTNKNTSRVFGILFTNKNCKTCHQMQKQLIQIIQNFNKINIHVYRCELTQTKKLAQLFNIKRFPVIDFIYKQEKYKNQEYQWKIYKTNSILNSQQFLNKGLYLQNVLNDKSFTHRSLPQSNLILMNRQYLEQEVGISYLYLRKNYMLNDLFSNLLIVALTQAQFDQYLEQNNYRSDQINVIVSVRGQTYLTQTNAKNNKNKKVQMMHFPINEYTYQNFDATMKSFLFYAVNQFTQSIFNIQKQISFQKQKIPQIFIAVLDSIWNRQESVRYIAMLNKVLSKFESYITIYWMQGEINKQKKTLLGFNQNDHAPLFAKFILQGQKYPLVDLKKKPIFIQLAITDLIKFDLGYEKTLPQKFKQSLQKFDIAQFITVNQYHEDQLNINSQTYLKLVICTGYLLKEHQLANLYNLGKRIQRFHKDSSTLILTTTSNKCNFSWLNKKYQQGVYITHRKNVHKISQKVQKCLILQQKLLNTINSFQNNFKLLPDNFCVQETQMRDYLLKMQAK